MSCSTAAVSTGEVPREQRFQPPRITRAKALELDERRHRQRRSPPPLARDAPGIELFLRQRESACSTMTVRASPNSATSVAWLDPAARSTTRRISSSTRSRGRCDDVNGMARSPRTSTGSKVGTTCSTVSFASYHRASAAAWTSEPAEALAQINGTENAVNSTTPALPSTPDDASFHAWHRSRPPVALNHVPEPGASIDTTHSGRYPNADPSAPASARRRIGWGRQ
jgi:hypothetical protein